MNVSSKVRSLYLLRRQVNRSNIIRKKSTVDEVADKVSKLKNGEPVKAWEVVALFGSIIFFAVQHLTFRVWEWEGNGQPGSIVFHNLGKYFYRKPIADQIAEQKRKDYAAGIDWKVKIWQE